MRHQKNNFYHAHNTKTGGVNVRIIDKPKFILGIFEISSDGEIKKVAVAKCENADENGYSRYYVDLTTSAKMNLVTLYVSIPNNTSYWNIKNIRLVQRLDKTIPQYSNGDRLYIASWKIS